MTTAFVTELILESEGGGEGISYGVKNIEKMISD